jgi:hypothetical protein
VVISSVRMASSRSDNTVEAPCIAVPPEMLTLVFGPGVEERDAGVDLDLGGGRSDMRRPAADGAGRAAGGGGVADFRITVLLVVDDGTGDNATGLGHRPM